LIQGTEAAAIHPAVAPLPTDIQIFKRRVSAFTSGDLDVILRSLKAEHLVLTGLATSGAVLSTLLEAFDLDFKITVLEDLVADHDQELHDVLVKKLFPKRATVVTADEWVKQVQ
jgi:nicotinamidase-related amidase